MALDVDEEVLVLVLVLARALDHVDADPPDAFRPLDLRKLLATATADRATTTHIKLDHQMLDPLPILGHRRARYPPLARLSTCLGIQKHPRNRPRPAPLVVRLLAVRIHLLPVAQQLNAPRVGPDAVDCAVEVGGLAVGREDLGVEHVADAALWVRGWAS